MWPLDSAAKICSFACSLKRLPRKNVSIDHWAPANNEANSIPEFLCIVWIDSDFLLFLWKLFFPEFSPTLKLQPLWVVIKLLSFFLDGANIGRDIMIDDRWHSADWMTYKTSAPFAAVFSVICFIMASQISQRSPECHKHSSRLHISKVRYTWKLW